VKVFVAGATGAVGRPLVRQLLEAGHEVTGTTRSAARAAGLERAGARAVVCDALQAEPLRAAVAAAEPDVVIHQLTALPDRFEPRKRDLYEPTNRIRIVGTRNLLDAAVAVGARRMICQSIAFAYAPVGGRVKEESDRLFSDAPEPFGPGVRAIEGMERAVVGAKRLEGIVLHYGWFYGPGTYFGEDGSLASKVRRRRYPIVGDGGGLFSFVHVDDAASATVAALERGQTGIYNVCDDEPAPLREWCRTTRRPLVPADRGASRAGWRGFSPARRSPTCPPNCGEPRTSGRGASSTGTRRGDVAGGVQPRTALTPPRPPGTSCWLRGA